MVSELLDLHSGNRFGRTPDCPTASTEIYLGSTSGDVHLFDPVILEGIDYGRWIFLATSLITFVLLGTSNQIQRNAVDVPLYAAILFIVLWLMPYTADLDYRSLLYFILDDPVSWTIDFLAQTLNPTQ